jgi:hypothetical protein
LKEDENAKQNILIKHIDEDDDNICNQNEMGAWLPF